MRDAGINVGCGGIVGMGEGSADRIGMIAALANLPAHPESVPINRLVRVEGTPLAETPPLDDDFAKSLGVKDANVVNVTANLKVRATPTVLLVNRQGMILGAWEGVGKEDRQAAILATIDSAAK